MYIYIHRCMYICRKLSCILKISVLYIFTKYNLCLCKKVIINQVVEFRFVVGGDREALMIFNRKVT